MSEIAKLIEIAKNEVGYLEKKSNSQLDDKTANVGSNNYTKFARDLDNISGFYNGKKNGYAWCDVFVDWCFVNAFGVDRALELTCQSKNSCGAGCSYSAKYYKNKGQFYTTPEVGDQIFFKNSKGICHTGLVYKVDSTFVYTIEGNTSSAEGVVSNGGCVREKKYYKNYSYIAGYGRPKYKEETVTENKTETKTTTEVKKETKKYIKINTSGGVWCRKGIGFKYAKYKIIPNNTKCELKTKNAGSSNGYKWDKVIYNGVTVYLPNKWNLYL